MKESYTKEHWREWNITSLEKENLQKPWCCLYLNNWRSTRWTDNQIYLLYRNEDPLGEASAFDGVELEDVYGLVHSYSLGESAILFMKPNTRNWPETAPKYFLHLVLQSSSFLAKVVNERAILAEIRMSKHFWYISWMTPCVSERENSSSHTIYFIFDLKLTTQKP